MLRDTNSRSPDLAEREVGLQVGEQPKLRRGQGRPAGRCRLRARGEDRAEFRYFVDEGAESRPVEQDVVDLPQQVTCGRLVGDGARTPWPAAGGRARRDTAGRTCRTAGPASPARAGGPPPSGRRGAQRAGPRRRRRARSWRSRAAGAHRRWRAQARRCSAASAHRPRSIANTASSDLAEDDGVDVAECRAPRRTSPRTGQPPGRRRRGAAAPRRTSTSAVARHGLHGGSCGDREARVGQPSAPDRRHTSAPATWPAPSRTTPCRPPAPGRTRRRRGTPPTVAPRRSARSTPRSIRPARRAGDSSSMAESPRVESHRCTVDMLAGLVGRQDQLRSPAGRIGLARWCSTGARGPTPGIRWTHTSRRLAGAASR